jgi:hypothetical protein
LSMRTMKPIFLAALLPLLATGCGVTVNNLTPKTMARNPSGLYTVSVEVVRNGNQVAAGTVQPLLVLPDRSVPMVPIAAVPDRWEYTVAVPPQVPEWPYYFKVNYQVEKGLSSYEPRSILAPSNAPAYQYVLRFNDNLPIGLNTHRARVGSEIRALAQAFGADSQVLLGGRPVPTRPEGSSVLVFQVPPTAGNKTYAVEVSQGGRKTTVGDLLVDESQFLASPAAISLGYGLQGHVDLVIPQPAPLGGLTVKLTVSNPELLDVPASITVPQGQSRITVTVKARHIGEGTITLGAQGFASGAIPFRVTVQGGR